MTELHRLTLRQINENPTLMSDEVFVPAEEVDALLEERERVRKALLDPEEVLAAMLRGTVAGITMRACAKWHGPDMLDRFNRYEEMYGDLKTTSDVLIDFPGEHVWQQAQSAIAHIDWLKNELRISQYNERAALDVIAQNNRHLHGGSCDGDEARQASGAAGAE